MEILENFPGFLNGYVTGFEEVEKSDYVFRSGEKIVNKHIVVIYEQGLGDSIQFSKYLIPLTKIAEEVTFIVQDNIRNLLGIPRNSILIGSFQKDGVGWKEGIKPKLIKGPDIFVKVLDKLNQLADRLSSEFEVNSAVIVADLSKANAAQDLFQTIEANGSQVDFLVNNAGLLQNGFFPKVCAKITVRFVGMKYPWKVLQNGLLMNLICMPEIILLNITKFMIV